MTCLICGKKIEGESWLSFMNDSDKLDCCSYICSNQISKKYPDYWDYVLNVEKFYKHPSPISYIKKETNFKVEHDMEKISNMENDEYNLYITNLNDYDKFINEYNEYKSYKDDMNEYESEEDDISVKSDY
jgi:hypothetical protein